ncbi:hypothetical protein K2P47_00475 [Patescibacteria group bacterium]|nr:hypothetical protein [Patescibacteria group bacterium]
MLFKILDNIRQKPKHIRDQYALGIAIMCTLMIGGVWSLSLPARFGGDSQVAALASTTNAVPFANFFTQLKNQFSGFSEAIDELPKATTTQDSIASTTQAALELQLSDENKQQIIASSTETRIEFGTGATTSSAFENSGKPVLVATTSDVTEPAR